MMIIKMSDIFLEKRRKPHNAYTQESHAHITSITESERKKSTEKRTKKKRRKEEVYRQSSCKKTLN